MILFCACACIDQHNRMLELDAHYSLDDFVFGAGIMIGLVMSVWISLFVGTEYSDGTIRNKIVIGHTRKNIYISNFVTCAFAGVVSFMSTVFATMLIGMPLFGGFKMEPSFLLLLFMDCLFACIAYAALFNLVAMVNGNKAYTAIINLSAAFFMLCVAIGIFQWLTTPEMTQQLRLVDGEWVADMVKNPGYLTGMKREVYQFLFDFIPAGQLFQVMNQYVLHPYRLPFYSLVIILLSNLIGIFFFQKKDLK